ncbi:MAG: SDR family oxidoreductase [Robiginitomaculum sp.]|nr:SDR family oxidoreductase [Robiginitomaculum sp.]
MNLRHINVLITGASRGTGAAIAKKCAEYGARVVLHYNSNHAEAKAVAASIGDNCIGLLTEDLSQAGAGARLWAKAVEIAKKVDAPLNGLVNNAGIDLVTDPYGDDAQWADGWAKIMAVNLQAPADLCRAALVDYRKAKSGRIVNICSRASIRGDSIDHPAYAASKGALLALNKTIARGAAADGVLAYALAPGWINTEMAPTDPDVLRAAKAEIPLGDFAQVEEIGALVAFLLSDLCPSATGATFDVNGASHVR